MKPLPILLPFSYVYGAAVALRNLFFENHIMRSEIVPGPVISVGNLTTGGTGKTPIVALIATMLREAGKRVAIVSRGYGRRTTGFVLVSDGTTLHATSDEAGDEAYLLAKKLAGVSVIVDEKRVRGARYAVEHLQSDVVVLDDGFQHRALSRDLDIVLIDSQQNPEPMYMLPAGHRREPLSGLARADAVIITKCDSQTDTAELRLRLRRYTDAPVFTSSYEPVSLIESRSGESVPLSSVGQASAVVFCGIGQPASFRKSAESAGIRIASFHAYGDHYRYGREDVKELAAAMNKSGADFYLTTEKDARRLDGAFDPSAPLYYLAMESCVRETEKFSALVHSLFADAPH